MIGLVFSRVSHFLSYVPREVWYALAALAVWWFASSHYVEQGRQEVLDELRAKQVEAQFKAEAARVVADEKSQERADEFEREQEVLNNAIEEAESTGGNALDGLFGSL